MMMPTEFSSRLNTMPRTPPVNSTISLATPPPPPQPPTGSAPTRRTPCPPLESPARPAAPARSGSPAWAPTAAFGEARREGVAGPPRRSAPPIAPALAAPPPAHVDFHPSCRPPPRLRFPRARRSRALAFAVARKLRQRFLDQALVIGR